MNIKHGGKRPNAGRPVSANPLNVVVRIPRPLKDEFYAWRAKRMEEVKDESKRTHRNS